jgi:hypothetical protein
VLALEDGNVRVAGTLREQVGLIFGAIQASPESAKAFRESIQERGLLGLSASAFARIVLNSPAGFCSKELSLRGPHTALSVGSGSGLAAVVVAAEMLSTRADVSFLLAASVDEAPPEISPEDAKAQVEGAAAVLLKRGPKDRCEVGDRKIELLGWAVSGPDRLEEAISACVPSRYSVQDFDVVIDERDVLGDLPPRAWATPSTLALAQAVSAIRRGETSRALITSDLSECLSVAVALSSE